MTELRLSRTLDAAAGEVWRALTSPAALREWFWPEQTFGTTAETDLREGGGYRIAGPRAGIAVSGRYIRLDPPRKLQFTWCWNCEEHESLVTIELTDVGSGTGIVVTHQDLADESECDANTQGWSDCLGRLPAWLASARPEE